MMFLIISEYNSSRDMYMDTGIDLTGHTSLWFQVKGANIIKLGLSRISPDYMNADCYEIAFNKKNLQLKRGEQGTKLDEYEGTSTVLNDNTYTPFWTTWANGHIQIGRGFTIGENILVEADDTTYDVNFIVVATKSGGTSYWRFYVNGRKPLGKF